MNKKFLLGIDIGTYESKGIITDIDGNVISATSVGHNLSIPQAGWAEHDAEEVWWHDFVIICRELLEASEIDNNKIAAIGVSAIAPCVLPIDDNGNPLRSAILYGVDTRADKEIVQLQSELGRDNIFAKCGVHLSSQAAGPKILWIRKNEKDIWKKTSTILTASGYLVFKLTGEKTIDYYTAAAYSPLLNIHKKNWDADCAKPIITLDRLPKLLWSTDIAGSVSEHSASETGLAVGTPVIVGTADAAAESLSAGLSDIGDLMIMYGSSIFFIQKTKELITTEKFWGSMFLEPNTYVVAGGMATGGSITRWFRDNFGILEMNIENRGGENAYSALAAIASESPLGSRGLVVLPYFSGERTPINDASARGLLLGLTISHSRSDCYRALLEGIGYGIRHNLDEMGLEGVPPKRLLAVGGGTKNELWLRIVSDIVGIKQYITNKKLGAAYGDAFMAGVGVGLFNDTKEISKWIDYEKIVQPNIANNKQYQAYYRIYRELYLRNRDLMRKLSEL